MLLSQQANLTQLTSKKIEITIASNWIGMIQSRQNIIDKAVSKALGGSREIIFNKQILSNTPNNTKKNPILLTKDQVRDTKENLEPSKFVHEKMNKNDHDLINKETEDFANFFNGEVVDLENRSQSE